MTWNYRVLRKYLPDKDYTWLEITEVHYEDGKPVLYAEGIGPVTSGGDGQPDDESLTDMKWTLERMLEALDKPILDERADFKS